MSLDDIATFTPVKYVSSKFELFLLIFNIPFTPFTLLVDLQIILYPLVAN